MNREIGKKIWVIAEGYIPSFSNGPQPEFLSHETICILNCGDRAAKAEVTIYFKDREPAGPFLIEVGARRTLHQRVNDFNDPERIPRGVDYSILIESSQPIVVQHSRLDSRQAENALLSTIAYSE